MQTTSSQKVFLFVLCYLIVSLLHVLFTNTSTPTSLFEAQIPKASTVALAWPLLGPIGKAVGKAVGTAIPNLPLYITIDMLTNLTLPTLLFLGLLLVLKRLPNP
jgi:hypothetical protein